MALKARVCIGLPVYNGQNYVAQAIQSCLNQTFTDLDLVISDNASTDRTGEICREFAAKDSRVHYHPLEKNIGAILNYERAYHLGGGQYFKWAAHDDLMEPTFLEKSVQALDNDPAAVLAYTRAKFIDQNGAYIKDYNIKLATDSPLPHVRFDAIANADHKTTHNLEIFGLMRRSAVDLIPQQGRYAASDRVFLARLAMYGTFVEVPETLFLSRDHPNQSIHTLPAYMRKKKSLIRKLVGHGQLPPAEWFDPKYKGRLTFPEWRLMCEYLSSVKYGWVSGHERVLCTAAVFKRQMTHGNWGRMVRDFLLAADKLMDRIGESIHRADDSLEDADAKAA